MIPRFCWQQRLDAVYSQFPEDGDRPVIGITGNYADGQGCLLGEGYWQSVLQAGGVPVVLPPTADSEALLSMLDRIDGLLLSGGADYNPLLCGEEPVRALGNINSRRDIPELLVTRLAYNRQIPMLGICRGIQTLAMALDGHVAQDIGTDGVKHSQQADRSEPTHTVAVEPGSMLSAVYDGVGQLAVNSFHHQAVDNGGQRLQVVARSTDGIVEAVESSEYKSIIGVQWHPECLGDDGQPLFRWLVERAAEYRRVCRLHDRLLTLDSHCDTPMFFAQGVSFAHRDSRLLVDLHKMTEGRLDATVMVCYLPQPQNGETFRQKIDFDVDTPREYADLIFDKIEAMAAANSDRLAVARTSDDLWANKHAGRKSILLGIENGLAIGDSLDVLHHFARRGIVYMTLCHNGDNQICDSARGSATHGGLSTFGRQVVAEMNRLGVIADLSHAAETSFYDALEVSAQPIVCSHSSCRSLCNHPRNLTDRQMKELADAGGVMQVTLYNGFLVEHGTATIDDALRHVMHAVDIMGIDHVGLGTDFDGDGGITGLASAAELTNFTRELLRRGFSDTDIAKLWGDNFLRVMRQVQSSSLQNRT